MNILIVYDGTLHAKTALRYGLGRLTSTQDKAVMLQIFDRASFIDYDAGPRAEAMARAEAGRQFQEARAILEETAQGKQVQVVAEEGDAELVISAYADRERFDLILVPPRYRSIRKYVQRPVYIIPGTILVPVDSTESPLGSLEKIISEARSTGSKVLLLGIVPVHLYSREEKSELEMVRKDTEGRILTLENALVANGVETQKIMRNGYPDEEILKAAEESSASMVIISASDDAPSELAKAAHIIQEEPKRLLSPLCILHAPATT